MQTVNIILLIACHKRPHLTKVVLESLMTFMWYAENMNIHITPLLALDEDDILNATTADELELNTIINTGTSISNKHSETLNLFLQLLDHNKELNQGFHYLMQLGSDDLLSTDILHYYRPEFERGTKLFGVDRLFVHDLSTGRNKYVYSECMIGAGRCIRWDIVEGMMGRLWDDGLSKGLDNNSQRNVCEYAKTAPVVVPTRHPVVLDVKSNVNIHSFDSLPGREFCEDKILDKLFIGFREVKRLSNPGVGGHSISNPN